MGRYTDSRGITNFEPDNDAETFHFRMCGECDIFEIMDAASRHFNNPNLSIEHVTFSAEYIHTDCIGYDLYDPSDYTIFMVIRLKK